MNLADRERVKELLSQAAHLVVAQRKPFIESAAGGNAEIVAEALELLHTLDDPVFMGAPTGAGFGEAPAPAPSMKEGPGTRIGRYKLLEAIGEGGFGSVFMAEQTEPVHRRIALKIIKAGMDTRQVIARFEAERQALALMDHPNIARVLDAGATDTGRPYFAMELVRGEPVTKFCDRERLPVRERLGLFRDVCHAVQHAHQKGIIHRDLKPSNVLVTVADGEPLPKVIDFGIAKATAGRLTDKTLFTELHQLIGTPEYMSPEQAEVSGVDIDTRSDVYSLGVLLYELLVGSTPLEGGRLRSTPMAEIQRLIREEEPARPSNRLATMSSSSGAGRLGPLPDAGGDPADSSAIEIARCRRSEPSMLTKALRGDLDWIVMKCLEKDRRRRYATASALADDVGRYLMDQPVLATPPSAGYRVRKFVRRNRVVVLAAVAVAAALLLGLVATSLQVVRADREAAQATAINEFMREVLTSVEPQNRGADTRLIEVLAAASATAPQRFASHPLQEAQVRDLLAQVYSSLAMWSEARSELGEALSLWRAHADPDDPRGLSTELMYAGAAINMGQSYVVEPVLAELLPRLERVLGPDHPTTLDARRAVALVDADRGRLDEAERVLLELRAHPKLVDDDSMQVRILHSLLGIDKRRASQKDDPAWHMAMMTKGEPLAREWVERSMRRHGPDGVVTLRGQVWLSQILCQKRQYAAAAEVCRTILDRSSKRLGECHVVRSEAWYVLAVALTHLGDEREPGELHLRRIDCLQQSPATDIIQLSSGLSEALSYLDRGGRAAEGEAAARELTGLLQNIGGGHGDISYASELYLARFVSMQDRLEEGEPMFQSLLAQEDQLQENRMRARLHLFYGSHLVRRHLFEQAEEQLMMVVELIEDIRVGPLDSHPDGVIVELVALYERWGKPDKAEEYRRLQKEITGP